MILHKHLVGLTIVTLSAVTSLMVALPAIGQSQSRLETVVPEAEFHMARLIYSPAIGGRGGWRPMWAIDYPDAEYHFLPGVQRLTRINTAGDSIHLRLTDDRIFDYPWLFAQQLGTWSLSANEISRLREYLLRGGFLVADDFHGSYDWLTFQSVISRVFPDRPIIDLSEGDEILRIFYDLDQRTQIPGRRHLYRNRSGGISAQMAGPATWRGIYDDENRLMVAINFNMDMGDAWEHADDPVYPQPMTALAYRFGINYLIYAMTH